MTQDGIKTYEYCKKDLEQLKKWKETLPFKIQNHGCGSQSPDIEYKLEDIHREMYREVIDALDKAIQKVEKEIEGI